HQGTDHEDGDPRVDENVPKCGHVPYSVHCWSQGLVLLDVRVVLGGVSPTIGFGTRFGYAFAHEETAHWLFSDVHKSHGFGKDILLAAAARLYCSGREIRNRGKTGTS